jgi:hypothetical protein
LLPYTVYEMLSLGELQPTSITLQLANRSIKRPRGILKDVLVKIGEFILPADFIVLNMEESPMPLHLPIIYENYLYKNLCEKWYCKYEGKW